MNNKIKSVVSEALLPVLLANTKPIREEWDRKHSTPQVDKVKGHPAVPKLLEVLNEFSLDYTYKRFVVKMCEAIIDETLEFGNPEHQKYEPLSVLVLLRDESGHGHPTKKPYIVFHGGQKRVLSTDGRVDRGVYNYYAERLDETRPATEEEIGKCVDSLTQAQLRTILQHDIFASIFE